MAEINGDQMLFNQCQEYENNLLEIVLSNSPFLAEELFKRQTLNGFDRNKVAALCDKAGLKHRALLLFQDTSCITKMFLQANNITNIVPANSLYERMDQLAEAQVIEASTHLLESNNQNQHFVENIVDNYLMTKRMQLANAIKLLEPYWTNMSYLHFLAKLLPNSEKQINLEYIQMTIHEGSFGLPDQESKLIAAFYSLSAQEALEHINLIMESSPYNYTLVEKIAFN